MFFLCYNDYICMRIIGGIDVANVDISVIIPSKNNRNQTAEIIRGISEELDGKEVEFIIIDMNSTDRTVLFTLNAIKKYHLRGCVIQSGSGNVGSALNTGIYRSNGKYVTFVYPSRLYKSYLGAYYTAAYEADADFVFSVPADKSGKTTLVGSGLNSIAGEELACCLINSQVHIDFGAVMIRRDYLLNHHISFFEDIPSGYSEAFIFLLMLYNPRIAYADVTLTLDHENSTPKEAPSNSNSCFDRIEGMLRVGEILKGIQGVGKLNALFFYRKIPSVVMAAVDSLMRDGFHAAPINKTLRLKKYNRLLRISKATPPKLRHKIIMWKTAPWLYKP